MNIDEVYSGKYLAAPDLQGRKIRVYIEKVAVEEFKGNDGTKQRKIILSFHGKDKAFALNKVNSKMIASMYGKDANGWISKEITLYPTKAEFRGEIVDAIRVEYVAPEFVQPLPARPPVQQPAPVVRPHMSEMQQRGPEPPPASPNDYGADMNDEVQF